MSGDQAVPVFLLGLLLLIVSVTLATNVLETTSWWPTLLFLPGLLFVLCGQLWFMGAFAEQPEASAAAVVMFLLICVLPPVVTLASLWSSGYDIMKWSAFLMLAPGALLLLLLVWPERWTRELTDEEIAELRGRKKRKLPG